MKTDVFTPADILLPQGVDMEKWSVIACDQFSSEPDYWHRVREKVGTAPSTLDMIVPEAFLEKVDIDNEAERIDFVTGKYIGQGQFKKIEDSFIYVERTLSDGSLRHGLVGVVDLDEYDFSGGEAAILASEGTVLDRLPPRVSVRRCAHLETPHIMAFIDDKDATVIEPLSEKADTLPLLYDFDLMEGGGHIKGMRVCGGDADIVLAAMRLLREGRGTAMVVGDGNHSLAAAKVYWDELKQTLSSYERKTHPAGKALLEVNNVYDPAISFEAIHRVIFDVDPMDFVSAFEKAMPQGGDYLLHWVSRGQSGIVGVAAKCIGDMLTSIQTFLDDYVAANICQSPIKCVTPETKSQMQPLSPVPYPPSPVPYPLSPVPYPPSPVPCPLSPVPSDAKHPRVDYVHGADVVMRLAEQERCLGLILPAMDKSDLFATVTGSGVFPKKSFSVGHARDKRYYLECRAINPHLPVS